MKIMGRYSPDIISESILELEVMQKTKTNDLQSPR